MSLKKIEEKRLEKQEGVGGKSSEKSSGSADKKLLSGTVQFYEDILASLPNAFIVIYNRDGKHLEVWTNPTIVNKTGINAQDLKGRLISEVFDETAAAKLKETLDETFKQHKPTEKTIDLKLHGRDFTFIVHLSPIPLDTANPITITAIFTLLTKQKKEKVVSSNQKTDPVFPENPTGTIFIQTNQKGIISDVSDQFASLSGYDKNDLTGYKISLLPIIKPNDVLKFEKAIARIVPTSGTYSFEWEWQNKNGAKKWSNVAVKSIIKEEKLVGFRFELIDITERKLFEKDLVKSRHTYKILIENAEEGIFVLQDKKIKFCNSKFTELLNFPNDQLNKKSFFEFVHPADLAYFNDKLQDQDKESQSTEFDSFRIIGNDHQIQFFKSRKVSIEWDNSPAMLYYISDITNQKQVQDELKIQITDARLLLDIYHRFIDMPLEGNILKTAAKKIHELSGAVATIMINYSSRSGYFELNHIEAPNEIQSDLVNILKTYENHTITESGFEYIKNLSNCKLIRYNDGIFEEGNRAIQINSLTSVQKMLGAGGIFLLGISKCGQQFGNAIIFLPEGKNPEKVNVIQSLARIVASMLARQAKFDTLLVSERKYRQVFDSLMDVYFTTDIDGVITEVSPSVKKLIGYEPQEIIGRLITDYYTEKENFVAFSRKLLSVDAITDYDIQCRNKAGKMIDASLNVTLLRDQNNKVIGSEGFLRDISKRKKAEEKFQKSEEKFRALADFTYDWEYWISDTGEIIYMSPSCERISGYSAGEFINDPDLLLKIVYPADVDEYHEHTELTETKDSKDVVILDYRIVTKGEEVKWINQVSRLVFDDDGNALGRRISNRDITERKLAEQELKNSEERFKTLFIDSPDAVIVEDYKGVILDVNPAACNLHKMDKEDLIGKNISDLVPETQKEEVESIISKWVSDEIKTYHGFIETSKGEQIPVELHGSKITFSGREALLFIVRDITEIVEKEKKMRESIEKAEEADMLKSAFLANMSHEIRTPMNAIIGFSEILTNQDLSKKEREEFIQYITQGSNTLMNLIEDIIDITKIEAGQIKIEFDDCPVGKLLDELYATFLKMKNKNGRRGVDLQMNKPNVEEGFSIHTDPHRIRQILSNLLGNAIKFTKEGSIEFGYNLHGANQIIFYVKDTGVGIPEDKLELIFERFGQVKENRNGNSKGTGLGLSISRKLAELLGGTLTVQSELGKGSTFYLTLPVNDTDFKEEIPASLKLHPSFQIDWSDKLFLIAEDSILNYTFLEALFQRTKVKLMWAKNGREAVEMCHKNKNIDLVLMDIKMPILSGLEAISQIKKFRPDLPIIVQTAYAMPEDREKSLEAGGDEHLTKPINVDDLFSTIGRFIH